jgi:hypothetical protein
MRALPIVLLGLLIGCGQQQSNPLPDVVGVWEAVGPYSSEGITVLFEKDGDVTVTSKAAGPVKMRYRIEEIATWHDRRAEEIDGIEGDTSKVFEGISHVVTVYRPEFPDEFNPSHNYFYSPTTDTLSVSLVFELRRKP